MLQQGDEEARKYTIQKKPFDLSSSFFWYMFFWTYTG